MSHYNNHRVNVRYTEDEENYDDEWYANVRRPQQVPATRTNPYANRSGVRFDDRIYNEERRSHQLAPRVSQSASSRTYPVARRSGPHDREFEDEMMLRQTGRMGRMDPRDETMLRHTGRMVSEDEVLIRQMGHMNLGQRRRSSLGRRRSGEERSRRHGDRSHSHDHWEAYEDEDWQEFGPLVQSRESGIRGAQHHHARGQYASSGCVLHPFGGGANEARCHCPCHGYDADDEVTITFTSRRRCQ